MKSKINKTKEQQGRTHKTQEDFKKTRALLEGWGLCSEFGTPSEIVVHVCTTSVREDDVTHIIGVSYSSGNEGVFVVGRGEYSYIVANSNMRLINDFYERSGVMFDREMMKLYGEEVSPLYRTTNGIRKVATGECDIKGADRIRRARTHLENEIAHEIKAMINKFESNFGVDCKGVDIQVTGVLNEWLEPRGKSVRCKVKVEL